MHIQMGPRWVSFWYHNQSSVCSIWYRWSSNVATPVGHQDWGRGSGLRLDKKHIELNLCQFLMLDLTLKRSLAVSHRGLCLVLYFLWSTFSPWGTLLESTTWSSIYMLMTRSHICHMVTAHQCPSLQPLLRWKHASIRSSPGCFSTCWR